MLFRTAREVYATGIPWTFSPCLCVARDERWGRTYESFGEDPEIASMMTTIIDGYQGADLGAPNTILATAKHWVGDGGTTSGVDQGDTQIGEAELRAIHIAPYEAAIQRGVGAVMPSYSSWNGIKMHANSYLINDVLKGELGLFDQPYADRTHIGEIGSPAHRAVARQAVRESLVLLQNDGILPLPKNPAKILVAGKNANNIGNQSGGWTISWQGSSGNITPGTTILQAIQNAVAPGTVVEYKERPNGQLSADFGIVVIGERPYAEGQGDDQHLGLDAADANAVSNVCSKMPCVVILISGRPMLVETQLNQSNAFVAAWLPGTEGQGVADVLFGDFNFTGTLPITWPRNMEQLPINVGDAIYDPLFPYGFGLRYP